MEAAEDNFRIAFSVLVFVHNAYQYMLCWYMYCMIAYKKKHLHNSKIPISSPNVKLIYLYQIT